MLAEQGLMLDGNAGIFEIRARTGPSARLARLGIRLRLSRARVSHYVRGSSSYSVAARNMGMASE